MRISSRSPNLDQLGAALPALAGAPPTGQLCLLAQAQLILRPRQTDRTISRELQLLGPLELELKLRLKLELSNSRTLKLNLNLNLGPDHQLVGQAAAKIRLARSSFE